MPALGYAIEIHLTKIAIIDTHRTLSIPPSVCGSKATAPIIQNDDFVEKPVAIDGWMGL